MKRVFSITQESKSRLRLNPKNPLSGVDFLDSNLISDFR